MRVLVTGGTGFLGRAAVAAMRARGIDVRALVRPTSDTEPIAQLGVECVVGTLHPADADQRERLRDAVRGVDRIVHLAGGGRARRPSDFFRNNAETTSNLLDAAYGSAVERFVFVSSMAARGPAPSAVPGESHVADAPLTAYGRSKLEAERAVLASGIPSITLRPPGIYGPGDDRHLPLFRAASRGLVPLPSAGRSASFVYVDDCAEAIVAALLDDAHHPTPHYVEDGDTRSTEETARLIGAAVGTDPRVVRVPTPVLGAAAVIAELVARFRGRAALLTRDKVKDMSQPHWVCDATPFRAAVDWTPRVAFAEGTERTARDYRERGWL